MDRKQQETIKGFLIVCHCGCNRSPPPRPLLGLADPVHSAYGLELVSRVEDRLHQQNVSGLNDVETIGASVKRKQEDVDPFIILEGAQILLEM